MDDENNGKVQGLQEANGKAAQGEPQKQASRVPLTDGGYIGDGMAATGANCEMELADR